VFHVGFGELLVIVVIALFVVGPTRLPKVAAEAGRMLRQLRLMAKQATASVRDELGPEFADVELADLHPRRFVRKHLFEDLDDDDVRDGMPTTSPATSPPTSTTTTSTASDATNSVRRLEAGERPPYDAEAT
jgi:sec-independent protein translocase protein TatB